MVDDTAKEVIGRELKKHLPEEMAEAIVDATDFDALLEEGELGDAVALESLGATLGGLIGRKAAMRGAEKAATRGIGKAIPIPGGPVVKLVGAVAGERAVKSLIKHVDWEAVEEAVGNNLHGIKATNSKRLKHLAKTASGAIPRVGVSRFRSRTESEDEADQAGFAVEGTINE